MDLPLLSLLVLEGGSHLYEKSYCSLPSSGDQHIHVINWELARTSCGLDTTSKGTWRGVILPEMPPASQGSQSSWVT